MSKYGNSFERSEILEWLKAGHGVCPLSRRPLSLQDLVTNHGLRMRIAEWRKENGDEDVVVVTPPTASHIYGFITLPSKDDGTDRTIDEEEDLFYLQLAALGLGGPPPQQVLASSATDAIATTTPTSTSRRRRNSTGGRMRSVRRPLRGIRNFFTGSSSTTTTTMVRPSP